MPKINKEERKKLFNSCSKNLSTEIRVSRAQFDVCTYIILKLKVAKKLCHKSSDFLTRASQVTKV